MDVRLFFLFERTRVMERDILISCPESCFGKRWMPPTYATSNICDKTILADITLIYHPSEISVGTVGFSSLFAIVIEDGENVNRYFRLYCEPEVYAIAKHIEVSVVIIVSMQSYRTLTSSLDLPWYILINSSWYLSLLNRDLLVSSLEIY